MKIAIIGGNSFLGKQIIIKLIETKKTIDLHVFGSSLNDTFKSVDFLTFHEYCYPEIRLDYLLLSDFDAIYFCAASGVQASIAFEASQIFGVNVLEPIQLSLELEKNNFKGKFITFGTYYEIGSNIIDRMFSEDDVIYSRGKSPNNYCSSKRLLTRYYSGNNLKTNWFHFILPNVYGPTENPKQLIPYLINSIQNNESIQVTKGTQTRQYIHINDVVDFVYDLLFIDSLPEPSIYILAPDNSISIKDLVETIFSTLNYNADNVNIINRADENMKFLSLDTSKTKGAFNWEPKIDLIAGIKTYL